MANVTTHRLEARAIALAYRMKQRAQTIRNAIAPAGERVPFSTQMTHRDALSWWQKNRYTPLGQQVIDAWPDTQREQNTMELDAALAQQNAQRAALANPDAGAADGILAARRAKAP